MTPPIREIPEGNAEYFATLDEKGKIAAWTTAAPPHKLLSSQFALTQDEYQLLRIVWGDVGKAARIIKSIRAKIKANMEAFHAS